MGWKVMEAAGVINHVKRPTWNLLTQNISFHKHDIRFCKAFPSLLNGIDGKVNARGVVPLLGQPVRIAAQATTQI